MLHFNLDSTAFRFCFEDKLYTIANHIYQNVGRDYPTKFYKEMFGIELQNNFIQYEIDYEFDIYYKDRIIGKETVDFFLPNDGVFIDIKTTRELPSLSDLNYFKCKMRQCNIKLGIYLHFAPSHHLSMTPSQNYPYVINATRTNLNDTSIVGFYCIKMEPMEPPMESPIEQIEHNESELNQNQ